MSRYLLRRLSHTVLVIIGISVISFFFLHLSGDPVGLILPQDATRAQIEASTRAGRIVVPEDRSEVTDDELDDAIEKLTWERTCRGIRRQAEEDALWRELPDEFLCPIGDITKYGNGDIKWFYLDPVESGLVGMPWVEWVKIAREIIDADQMARAAVALERAA